MRTLEGAKELFGEVDSAPELLAMIDARMLEGILLMSVLNSDFKQYVFSEISHVHAFAEEICRKFKEEQRPSHLSKELT